MWVQQLKHSPPIKRKRNGSLIPLTPEQKRRCMKLIRDECANYDEGYCLVLDDGYSFCAQKQSNHLYCRWFQNFVLPLNEELMVSIIKDKDQQEKHCKVCGKVFAPKSNRAKYCNDCAKRVHKKQNAEYMKKRYHSGQIEARKCL